MGYQYTSRATAVAKPTKAAVRVPGWVAAAPLKEFENVLSRFSTKLVSEENSETDTASAAEPDDADDVDAIAVLELVLSAVPSPAVVISGDDELSPTAGITGDGLEALELVLVVFSVGDRVVTPLGEGVEGTSVSDVGAAVGMEVVGEGVAPTGAFLPGAGDNVWADPSVVAPGGPERAAAGVGGVQRISHVRGHGLEREASRRGNGRG